MNNSLLKLMAARIEELECALDEVWVLIEIPVETDDIAEAREVIRKAIPEEDDET